MQKIAESASWPMARVLATSQFADGKELLEKGRSAFARRTVAILKPSLIEKLGIEKNHQKPRAFTIDKPCQIPYASAHKK